MQTDQITFVHNRRSMRFSGIYRCIFTNRPMLWLIDSNGFKLIDMLKRRQLFLCGRQGSGKSTIAKMIANKIRNMGFYVDLIDEIQHSTHLEEEIAITKRKRSQAIQMEHTLVDLTIYCYQNNFLVPDEYQEDVIILNN